MCCSYGYDHETVMDISEFADWISPGALNLRMGDVRPSESALILKAGQDKSEVYADEMPWGFFSFDKKLLINARAESAMEKKSFSDSVLHRRCIIPAKCFYEWDKNKIKNTFSRPEGSSLYMAGFYNLFENQNRFIILTTAANETMKPVHDRMPLILEKDQIRDWLWRDDMISEYLSKRPQELKRMAEYEQLSLF